MKRATSLQSLQSLYKIYFNPRPHEEGDTLGRKLTQGRRISIHALMKRATDRANGYIYGSVISIHALMKRATFSMKLDTPLIDNFNPRPHEEGDIFCAALYAPFAYFNPRPHEEGDAQYSVAALNTLSFQSTPS